jgi:hypothetical protein
MSEAKEQLERPRILAVPLKESELELLEMQRLYLELNGQFRKLRMF